MPTKTKYTLHDLVKQYESQNIRITDAVYRAIVDLINGAYTEIAYFAAKSKLVNNRFLQKPVRAKIDSILETLNDKITLEIQKGLVKSWALSEEKVQAIETEAFGGGSKKPPIKTIAVSDNMENNFGRIRKAYGGGSETALREFIKRKDNLPLSKRVWRQSRNTRKFIMDTMAEGIKNGTSARELSKELRSGVNAKGQGPGVYKDPKKNAYRLARNEINTAYRTNSHRHYQTAWWIIGIKISLSLEHPRYDFCDEMAGDYPKDFIFTKWHVNCLCFDVPILCSIEEREAMSDFNLGLTDRKPRIKYITKIPASARAWVRKNRKRMEGWKSQPEFLTSNEKYF